MTEVETQSERAQLLISVWSYEGTRRSNGIMADQADDGHRLSPIGGKLGGECFCLNH